MSNMDINQVLAQMRAMAAAAEGRGNAGGDDAVQGADFGALLQSSIEQVNDAQAHARELANAFETGDTNVELPEVMIALQKASVSFQAITQVRNKLLNAYQEVMNMQV